MERVEAQVGEKRTFTFSNNEFIVKEVIDNPQIRLPWTWTDSVCPHCKNRINRDVIHEFYKLELLVDVTKAETNFVESDIVILGHSKDNRLMQFPQDKYQEVFHISKEFRRFIN